MRPVWTLKTGAALAVAAAEVAAAEPLAAPAVEPAPAAVEESTPSWSPAPEPVAESPAQGEAAAVEVPANRPVDLQPGDGSSGADAAAGHETGAPRLGDYSFDGDIRL